MSLAATRAALPAVKLTVIWISVTIKQNEMKEKKFGSSSLGNARCERLTSAEPRTIWQNVVHAQCVPHAPRRVLNAKVQSNVCTA